MIKERVIKIVLKDGIEYNNPRVISGFKDNSTDFIEIAKTSTYINKSYISEIITATEEGEKNEFIVKNI